MPAITYNYSYFTRCTVIDKVITITYRDLEITYSRMRDWITFYGNGWVVTELVDA